MRLIDIIHTHGTAVLAFALRGDEKRRVEAFLHTQENGYTVCLSTQNGCAGGCVFCGAASQVMQLTANDIVAQFDAVVAHAGFDPSTVDLSIDFIVLGEPMHNLNNVERAIRVLHDRYPHARLVLCSIMPQVPAHRYTQLMRLLQDVPTMELHVSLHRTTDAERAELITLRQKLTLDQIAAYGAELVENGMHGRVIFNYVVQEDENNRPSDLESLLVRFPPSIWGVKVSVLCIDGDSDEARARRARNLEATKAWRRALSEHGYVTRLHNPSGQDIGAGSGILRNQFRNNSLPATEIAAI